MKQSLNYGKLTWSYDDFNPGLPCRPSPFIRFSPVRINGKYRYPMFSDKVALSIIKFKSVSEISFRDAYLEWFREGSWIDRDLGEGRSFMRWLEREKKFILWKPGDFELHAYFTQKDSPKHDPHDEMAKGLSFAVRPVKVNERNVKLYLQDEAVLNLISMPFGEDEDFLKLVEKYVSLRFKWESWRAPAPTFLDWVKAQARRPVFSSGQLGFCG